MTTVPGGGSSTPSEAFLRDGAVVIRNALDPDTMALLRRVYDSAYGPNRGLPPLEVEAARSDAERMQGTQGTVANILSFDTQLGDIVAFHWATFHGGGATPPKVKRRTMALRYVGPRCFMSPRSTNSPEQRERWLKSKIHPFEGPEPAFRLIPFFGGEEKESPTNSGITYGDRLQ